MSIAKSEHEALQNPDYFETIDAMAGPRVLQLWVIGQRLGNGQRRERFFDVAYGEAEHASLLVHFGSLLNTTEEYVIGAAGRSRVPDWLLQRYYDRQERFFLSHRLTERYSPWNTALVAGPDELDNAVALANRPILSHADAILTDRELCETILRTEDPGVLQLLWLRHAMVCTEAELLIGADARAELSDIAIRNAARACSRPE